jgi:hypothetical protein
MRKGMSRTLKAAILALAAGALTAVANPAHPIERDASTAFATIDFVAHDTLGLAHGEIGRAQVASATSGLLR